MFRENAITIVLATLTAIARHGHTPAPMDVMMMYVDCVHVLNTKKSWCKDKANRFCKTREFYKIYKMVISKEVISQSG